MRERRQSLCLFVCICLTAVAGYADDADDSRLSRLQGKLKAAQGALEPLELVLKNYHAIQALTNELIVGKLHDRTPVSQLKAEDMVKLKRFKLGWYLMPNTSIQQFYEDLCEIRSQKKPRKFLYISPTEGGRLADAFAGLAGMQKADTGPNEPSIVQLAFERHARVNAAKEYATFVQLISTLLGPHLVKVNRQREVVKDLEWQVKSKVTVLGVPTDSGTRAE